MQLKADRREICRRSLPWSGIETRPLLRWVEKAGVAKQLLWKEHRNDPSNGYGYTQFCEYIKHLIRICWIDEMDFFVSCIPLGFLWVDKPLTLNYFAGLSYCCCRIAHLLKGVQRTSKWCKGKDSGGVIQGYLRSFSSKWPSMRSRPYFFRFLRMFKFSFVWSDKPVCDSRGCLAEDVVIHLPETTCDGAQ